jgi:hypothetical protein
VVQVVEYLPSKCVSPEFKSHYHTKKNYLGHAELFGNSNKIFINDKLYLTGRNTMKRWRDFNDRALETSPRSHGLKEEQNCMSSYRFKNCHRSRLH